MSLDLDALRAAVAAHGRVARVVVAETRGSAPREPGAAMLVWAGGQAGTIGGGTLEWEAAARARERLGQSGFVTRQALGPDLGQCCGGAVVLATEVFDAAALSGLELIGRAVLRAVTPAPPSLKVERLRGRMRQGWVPAGPLLADGWLAEPLAEPTRALWVHGAGHVGRAVVAVMAPLPGWAITWLDTAAERFPEAPAVTPTVGNPAEAVAEAPAEAHHLVLTYSHALDLEICHRLLAHGFGSAGLIGSATKWARFRKRLMAAGHGEAQVDRIRCPIGDPALGKAPQAIAVGVAAELLRQAPAAAQRARA